MTLATNEHPLPEDSQAVRVARVWVRDALTSMGRDDLIEGAELCVSELVTNALLHGQPPFEVRLSGSTEKPIIGVHDGSVLAPKLTVTRDPSEDDPLNTFGRGLTMVASYSAECGSKVDDDGSGKTVWFEPKAEPSPIEHPDVFDIGDLLADLETSNWAPIDLLGVPMPEFLALSQRFEEFNRELQLLCLNSNEENPAATEFTELVALVREDLRAAVGNDVMWAAMTSGEGRGDFRLKVDPLVADRSERILELMDVLLNNVGQHTLLSAQFSSEDLRLQVWYFEQFINQIRGGPPERWTDEPEIGPTSSAV